MMGTQTCVVPRSIFGRTRFDRLDAEFVTLAALQLEESLLRLGGRRLGSLTQGYEGPSVNDKWAEPDAEVGYIDLDAVDLTDGLTYVDEIVFAGRPSRAKYVVNADDLLVANVRPNRGAVSWATNYMTGMLASSGFTLLRPLRGHEISVPTLYAYLRSTHARHQLVRRTRGSMYPAVMAQDVMDIVVPAIPSQIQSKVDEFATAAHTAHERFFAELRAADDLLAEMISNLGYPPSPLESTREGIDTTVIRRTDALGSAGAKRLDAEFFREEYDAFHQTIREAGNYFKLNDYYFLQAGRRLPGVEGIATFKQGCLTNAGINWSAVRPEAGKAIGSVVQEGDILLASTAHEIYYVGRKVDVVRAMPDRLSQTNQAVAELMILRGRDCKPSHVSNFFVAAFLRHPAGLHQVQRCIRGLRGGHTYAKDLGEFVLVPDLGPERLSSFGRAWVAADRTRQTARAKMVDATRVLEEWLESEGVLVTDGIDVEFDELDEEDPPATDTAGETEF